MRPFAFYMKDYIAAVKAMEKCGSKFGTDRANELLKLCSSPDEKLKIIHVAGSNGKGSECAMLTSVLVAAGKKTGTFTSPEVFSYCEKFCIDGVPAPKSEINFYLSRVFALAEKMEDKPTAFEIETCAALFMFACEGCEYAVIECGLGGLNDSTNAVSGKVLAVITSVSLEHTAVLGKDIMSICRQKAGIINNCPAVVPCNLPSDALEYLLERGAQCAGDGLSVLRSSLNGQKFRYRGKTYAICFCGVEQAYNAAVAIDCARILKISEKHIKRGLKNARLDGRMQAIKKQGTLYILDGSHNPAAFSPLVQTIAKVKGKKTLVFGCLSDKDAESAAEILGGLFDRIILVPAPSYRAMDIKKTFAAFCDKNKNLLEEGEIFSALGSAKTRTVVVCGSFTLLKEAKKWIEQRQ